MSREDPVPNEGAKAVEENLAGTRDEFNDEVTQAMVEDLQQDESPGDNDRDSQPALEVDEETPATPGKASS